MRTHTPTHSALLFALVFNGFGRADDVGEKICEWEREREK